MTPGTGRAALALSETRLSAVAGLAIAVPPAALFLALPQPMARAAAALALAVIAAIYVGFALAQGTRRQVVKQSVGCCGFIALALMGLWGHPVFLVAGLAAHAGWDLLDHGPGGLTARPRWYAPFCAVADLALAACAAWALLG